MRVGEGNKENKMQCKICGDAITNKEDVHWLDDILVCSECYEHETGEENV